MSSLELRRKAVLMEQRRSRRLIVEIPVGFRTVSGTRECQLANISDNGAKLELPSPPTVGVSGWLVLEGSELYCKVIWSDEKACGVEFERALGQKRLGQIVGAQARELGPAANTGKIQAGRKRSGLVCRS